MKHTFAEFLVLLFVVIISFTIFELVIEKNLKIRARMIRRLGKLTTWIINTLISMFLLNLVYQMGKRDLKYTALYAVVFSFFNYSSISIYTTEKFMKNKSGE